MGAGHPECPERLGAIEDRLLISGVDMALQRREATPASLADIELAHGRMHVAALRGLGDALREDMAAGGPKHTSLDPDTMINVHTWDAALAAAGAALDATDAVLAGENPVRAWRRYRGLTIAQLAEKAGVSAAYLSQIETGARAGTVETLGRIAVALAVNLDDLT
jgi:acetoin utilization deacetylase AcuC-like enzyme